MTTPPQSYAPAAATPVRRTNPLGLTAVILVAIAVALSFVASGTTGALIANASGNYQLIGLVSGVLSLIQALLALAAVGVGIAGLVAKDRPRALAGMGLGGGAVIVLGVAAGQLTNLILTLSSS